MKLRYYLKRRGDGPHPIYIALYAKNETELIYTGERIHLKDWSIKERTPKNHNSDISKAIGKAEALVKKSIKRLEFEERPVTPLTVKITFVEDHADREGQQTQAEKKYKQERVTLIKLAEKWTEEELFRFRKSSQKVIKENIKLFTSYLKSAGYATLERKSLTHAIISGYDRYLLEKRKLADNSHGTAMKQLRWFLKWLDFDVSKIKIRSSYKTKISLSLEELKKLESVDVSFDKEYQKAKDMFLLGCYTGLRISDLKRLNGDNTKDGLIKIQLLKNDVNVTIPIIKAAGGILSRYGNRSPRTSRRNVNESIKIICEKAGINEKIVIDYTRGGQKLSKTTPKYKVITTHVAGKTFITLAPKLWGLSPAEIAAIVGKDINTLLRHYFGDQGDEARQKMITRDKAQLSVSS